MTVEYFDVEQGSDEWKRLRCGIVTASEFGTILAKGRSGGESETRRKYLLRIVGERITGEPAETYTNAHMERGKLMEDDARTRYAFERNVDPTRVGFARNVFSGAPVGASPDSLMGEKGTLEIKSKLPHLQIEVLLAKEMPWEHKAQVQGQLMVCEREWCDFVSYWPKLPLFVKRIYRDEPYIRNLESEICRFNTEAADLEAKIRAIA
jgi:hypothetical protein